MSFSEEKAKQKLAQLTNAQQSIQTTSQWCLFHYRHADEIVDLLVNAFVAPDSSIEQSEPNYRLSLFYLANDLVQFSKKKESKYSPFLAKFSKTMPQLIEIVAADNTNVHLKQKYLRVLDVWKQRSIFPVDYIQNLQKTLNTGSAGKTFIHTATSNNQAEQKGGVLHNNGNGTRNDNHNNGIKPSTNNHNNLPAKAAESFSNGLPSNPVPDELVVCVSKYNQLNALYKSYKANFMEFNSLSSKLLDQNTNAAAQKETQLNNILSSLSSLKKLTGDSESHEDSNPSMGLSPGSAATANEELEMKRFGQVEALAGRVESEYDQLTQLRVQLATELRRLAVELDDWIMLDQNKQAQFKETRKRVDERKGAVIEEREKVSVYNYNAHNDTEENVPKYDETDDNSDSDAGYNNSSDDGGDSDSDGDTGKASSTGDDEFAEEPRPGAALPDGGSTDGPGSGAVDASKPASSLRKRLLGDDGAADAEDRKRTRKSVSFAQQDETRVFDKNESIQPEDETAGKNESLQPEDEAAGKNESIQPGDGAADNQDPTAGGGGDDAPQSSELEHLLGLLS